MKKTCLKNISVLLTTSLMIGGLCFPINGGFCVHASASEQAQDTEEIVLRTDDYREMELIDGGTMSTYEFEERFSRKTTHSSASDQTYAKYTSDAIYNVLSTSEKQFYNRLYDLCSGYLTGTDNLSSTRADKVTYTVTSAVPYYGMTSEDAYTLTQFFSAENPQFYFLDNAVVYTSSGNKSGTVQLECFDIFKNGNTRATYTKSFFKTADNIIAAANKKNSTEEKEKYIHDYLCRNVRYVANDYDQSCYSALMLRTSVCAGYSEAFALLCNGAGIETISVTSQEHEWNQVKIGEYWYAVDCTWDDQDYGIIYDFYNKSDSTLLSYNERSNLYHTPTPQWAEFGRPLCMYDYGKETGSQPAQDMRDDDYVEPEPEPEPEPELVDPVDPEKNGIVMYRLYNRNSGEHFYTASMAERQHLVNVGWQDEGEAWEAPAISLTPVYRLYTPYSPGGEHFYTTNAAERDYLVSLGWQYEGIGWYSDDNKAVPVYRQFNKNANTNSHNYTTNLGEVVMLILSGWADEGIAWYGL